MVTMLKTWGNHTAIAAVITLALVPFGLVTYGAAAAIGFYVFREVEQHLTYGTVGRMEWVDRIGDAVCPTIMAVLLAVLL